MMKFGSISLRGRWSLHRFRKNEDGVVTMEFMLWFPVFFLLFLSSIEAAFVLARNIMLERGLDIAVRDVRLGIGNMTHDAVKQKVCENAIIIPNCVNSVRMEMKPVSTTTWSPLTNRGQCTDRSVPFDPADTSIYDPNGTDNQLMLVRVCLLANPIFPTTGVGLQLPVDAQGDYALIASSAFVNEPTGR